LEILFNICKNIFYLLHEMAPYLLLGFGVAGVLSVLFSKEQIQDKIGAKNFTSCLKAVLYGIPLPLCSCGVIPVSASLKRHGASKGAIISFLTTTPQTGVDSIMVTYSMLGLPILILKLIVALVSGLFAGIITNFLDKKNTKSVDVDCADQCCDKNDGGVIKRSLAYGFKTLPKDIVEPLLVGLVLAGFIGLLAQDDFSYLVESVKNYHSIVKILIIMIISIPLYICATASIPVALMIASIFGSPGAAIALLIAGPATNLSGIATCNKIVGKRSTLIYVASVFVFAFIAGVFTDFMEINIRDHAPHMHGEHISFFSYLCVFILLSVLGFCLFDKKKLDQKKDSVKIKIEGMTCSHCESNVIGALLSLSGIKNVQADHRSGEVILEGSNYDINSIEQSIKSLNYKIISK